MTDRELLELAAKAAGIEIHHWSDACRAFMCADVKGGDPAYGWNPLNSDADALRLAVKLRLDVMFGPADVEVTASQIPDGDNVCPWSWFALMPDKDNNAATRRAIVQAAAEVGKRPNIDSVP